MSQSRRTLFNRLGDGFQEPDVFCSLHLPGPRGQFESCDSWNEDQELSLA